MTDERTAVFAGRVMESVGGGVLAVNQDHAFKAGRYRRKRCGVPGRFRLTTTDDAHMMTFDFSFESFTGPLAHLRGLGHDQILLLRSIENRFGQRMLRVALQARGQPQHQIVDLTPAAVKRSVRVGCP